MKVNPENGKPIPTKGNYHNYRKLFEQTFKQLTSNHNAWQVWQDFVSLSALSIANAVDKREEVWQNREDEYMAIIKRYSKSDLELLPKLLGYTTMALDTNPCQDFLGQLYMDLDFGRSWKGQFFTPWHVAEMMAKMQVGGNISEKISDGGYISVADPCCGAGVMLLAFAQVCKEDYKINYQQSILFVAQDIDPVVAKMCYIQMSLLGLPGYVAIGDSLSKPVIGTGLNPDYDAESLWFTPLFYSDIWVYRKLFSDKDLNMIETMRKKPEKLSHESKMVFQEYTDEEIMNSICKPKTQRTFSTSEKDISLAKKELSKLEQQRKSVKRFLNKGKEQLKNEIKSKNSKKPS